MQDSAYKFDLINDYSSQDSSYISYSPYWAIAVYGMSNPVTFSRDDFKSGPSVEQGVKLRSGHPIIITDLCVGMSVESSKRNHTKSLQASIKNGGLNLLNSGNVVPGDWIMAWCWTNDVDRDATLRSIVKKEKSNGPRSGLKFIGRVHDIRKNISVNSDGMRESSYSLQAIGFDELDTQLYYDFNLASQAATDGDFALFMSQIGLDFFEFQEKNNTTKGLIKDNSAPLIEGLVNIVVGTASRKGNGEIVRSQAQAPEVSGGRELNRVTTESYVIPNEVATTLGVAKKSDEKTRYSEILETIIGVQKYQTLAEVGNSVENFFVGFYPVIDPSQSTNKRWRTEHTVKGSHLPLEPSFVNKPLYSILQTYMNPAINEMYTALKSNLDGDIVPTLIIRQIPFSTEAMAKKEHPSFPLTRFLQLPRWFINPTMVTSMSVGRSNSTRFNMVHVYGTANNMADPMNITQQMTLNPPIFDLTDITRSGMRPYMQTVSCTIGDLGRQAESRPWMEAISDWTLGSHLTLNGQMTVTGVQSPIAEGDNIEFEGVVYHIESLQHQCSISPDGRKQFHTTLSLSNGMPSEQTDVSVYPRYPGFIAKTENKETVVDTFDIDVEADAVEEESYGINNLKGLKPSQDKKTTKQTIQVVERSSTYSLTPDDEILTSQDPGEGTER